MLQTSSLATIKEMKSLLNAIRFNFAEICLEAAKLDKTIYDILAAQRDAYENAYKEAHTILLEMVVAEDYYNAIAEVEDVY